MLLFLMLMFAMSLEFADLHCAVTKTRSIYKGNRKDCRLEIRRTGVGAGVVRNLTGKCATDNHSKRDFSYQLSWMSPADNKTAVSNYLIRIRYSNIHRICFKLPASQTTFLFNKSVGLVHGCKFMVTITALPVVFREMSFHQHTLQVESCPLAPKMSPLLNIASQLHSVYSFVVNFSQEPTQPITISWYHSSDHIFCRDKKLLTTQHRGFVFSSDRRTLTLSNISSKHVGCYVVIANNSLGYSSEVRGYLKINRTLFANSIPAQNFESEIMFGALAVVMVLMAACLTLIVLKHRMAFTTHHGFAHESLFKKKVYLSHSIESAKERAKMMQFVNRLQGFNIDVIVDILSECEINNFGGLSRWIPERMKSADRIIIFLTSKFVEAMTPPTTDGDDKTGERRRKVHAELNYLTCCQPSTNGCNRPIVVSMKVHEAELPHLVRHALWFMLPNNIQRAKSSEFRLLVEEILGNPEE